MNFRDILMVAATQNYGPAAAAPSIPLLRPSSSWTGTANSGNPGGVAPSTTPVVYGSGKTYQANADANIPANMWIESLTYVTIGWQIENRNWFTSIEFLFEGTTATVTQATVNPTTGCIGPTVQIGSRLLPSTQDGEAILWAHVIPVEGTDYWVQVPVILNTNLSIVRPTYYVVTGASPGAPYGTGDDTRSAATASNPATPWRSIITAQAKSLNTGARVYCVPDATGRMIEDANTVAAGFNVNTRPMEFLPAPGYTADTCRISRTNRLIKGSGTSASIPVLSQRCQTAIFRDMGWDLARLATLSADNTPLVGGFICINNKLIDDNGVYGPLDRGYCAGVTANGPSEGTGFFLTGNWAFLECTMSGAILSGGSNTSGAQKIMHRNTKAEFSADVICYGANNETTIFGLGPITAGGMMQPGQYYPREHFSDQLVCDTITLNSPIAGQATIVWALEPISGTFTSVGTALTSTAFNHLGNGDTIQVTSGAQSGQVRTVTIASSAYVNSLPTAATLSSAFPADITGETVSKRPTLTVKTVPAVGLDMVVLTGAKAGKLFPIQSQGGVGATFTTVVSMTAGDGTGLTGFAPGDAVYNRSLFHADLGQQNQQASATMQGLKRGFIQRVNAVVYNAQPFLTQSGLVVCVGNIDIINGGTQGLLASANSFAPDDFIYIGAAGANQGQSRRIASIAGNTLTFASPFPADQASIVPATVNNASTTGYIRSHSMSNFSKQLCRIKLIAGGPEQGQYQHGHMNFSEVQCTYEAVTCTFRADNVGFGIDGMGMFDNIYQQLTSTGTFPAAPRANNLDIDGNQFIDGTARGTNSTLGAVTFDADGKPTGARTFGHTPLIPFDINGNPLTAASPVGAVGS